MRKQWKSTMRHVKRKKSCFQSGCPLQWQERLRRCCCECRQGQAKACVAVRRKQGFWCDVTRHQWHEARAGNASKRQHES